MYPSYTNITFVNDKQSKYKISSSNSIDLHKDDPCQNGKAKCSDSETCVNGICKCGDIVCTGNKTAPYCDANGNDGKGTCKCSATETACTGDNVDKCANGVCSCGSLGRPCNQTFPICKSGQCGKYFIS